jgi:RNA polymerase sigma factor (sigma-70 family)
VKADRTVAAAVADAHASEWAYVLAATVRVTADLDLAEECVQVAFTRALSAWKDNGIPNRPGAWLTTTAKNVAIDQLRRQSALKRRLPLLVEEESAPSFAWGRGEEIDDDRLRLVFTCCHPALSIESQLALTLRLVCGLSTMEVARAFLVSDATMAARITRAKRKITQARIPYRTPPLSELPARITAVLQVVHLVFTTGHASPSEGELVRDELVERATSLARMLRELLPSDPGVAGLLGLILLTDARRASRVSGGELVLLEDQDRSRWDRDAIAEGSGLIREALEAEPPSRYALLGAIAEVHDTSVSWAATNWAAIVRCYDLLDELWPSPVVSLNRAVAIGFASGPEAGLRLLDSLADDPRLATYPYFAAARADFSRRVGDLAQAKDFYEEALMLTGNEVERTFLERRVAELDAAQGSGERGPGSRRSQTH